MKRNFWTLALAAALATGLVHAQQTEVRSNSRTQQAVRPGQGAPANETAPAAGAAISGNAPAAKLDPGDLQSQIIRAFQQDPALAAANLGAYVSTDKISLAGTVKAKGDKDRAQGIAESMANGRAVVNDIRVRGDINYITRPATTTFPSGTTMPSSGTATGTSGTTNPSGTTPPR